MTHANIFNVGTAILGGTTAYFFGDSKSLLEMLLLFVIIDYISGILAAAMQKKLKSNIGFIGIARKVFIFFVVAMAHKLDTLMGNTHMLRDATIFFYLANELLSIMENAKKANIPIPQVISRAIEVLKGKSGEENETEQRKDKTK